MITYISKKLTGDEESVITMRETINNNTIQAYKKNKMKNKNERIQTCK